MVTLRGVFVPPITPECYTTLKMRRAGRHTCHLQQPVCQGALPMVNVGNDAEIPDFVHRKLGEVNGLLKNQGQDFIQSHCTPAWSFPHVDVIGCVTWCACVLNIWQQLDTSLFLQRCLITTSQLCILLRCILRWKTRFTCVSHKRFAKERDMLKDTSDPVYQGINSELELLNNLRFNTNTHKHTLLHLQTDGLLVLQRQN